MADYKEVVEMLGDNLASFLEVSKKFLIDWGVGPKKLLHFLHNIPKDHLLGLLNGTHEVVFKQILLPFNEHHQGFMIYKQQRRVPWKEMLFSLVNSDDYNKLCVLKIEGEDDYHKVSSEVEKQIEVFCCKNKKIFTVFENYFLLVKYRNDYIVTLIRFHSDYQNLEMTCVNLTTCVGFASSKNNYYVVTPK